MSTLITADGLSLHVRVVGRDDAPTVVLVHGLTGSVALSWAAPGDRAAFTEYLDA